MKVVLLQDIKGSGKKDDVIDVSDGYARNYLFPRKLAKEVTASVMNELAGKKEAENHRRQVELEEANRVKGEIDGQEIVIKAKSGSGDRLFGSVTAKEIAAAIKEKTGNDIDRRKITLDTEIKHYGRYEVAVKIHSGVAATVTVVVEE